LPDFSVAWTIWAAVAILLTLAATAGTVIAVAKLWRFRTDSRVIAAAERLEAVNLTAVVKRHVPSELQTQNPAAEIAVAKEVIAARRPRWTRIALVSSVVMLCAATAATFSVHRNMQVSAVARLAAKPRLNLDVLKAVQGVWGWRADFLQSCAENPQTVAVASDRKKLSVRYAKPYQDGLRTVTNLDFDVISATPDTLVLSDPDSATPKPAQVYVNFLDANSYSLSRSDAPMKSSGAIERCPPPRQ
jgi:uncharacterized membrane protein